MKKVHFKGVYFGESHFNMTKTEFKKAFKGTTIEKKVGDLGAAHDFIKKNRKN